MQQLDQWHRPPVNMIFCLCCPQDLLQMSSWLPLVSCTGSAERKSTLSTVCHEVPRDTPFQVSMTVIMASPLSSMCSQFTYRPSTQLFMQTSNRHSIHVHLLRPKMNSCWIKLVYNTFHAFRSRVSNITPTKSTYCIERHSQCLELGWWSRQKHWNILL